MRKLELRHNNAYDTVLLLDDLVIIGAWTVTPEVKANWDNPGDLNDWEPTNVLEHDPEDYGELEATKYEPDTTKSTELFKDDEPVYQPALSIGIRYREPWSRETQTGWFTGDEDNPYQDEVTREHVAAMLNVSVEAIIKWENETDYLAEEASRDDYGDY